MISNRLIREWDESRQALRPYLFVAKEFVVRENVNIYYIDGLG